MLTFLLWLLLLVICWPLALLALILYPLVWLLLLPFRIIGIAVEGVLQLVWAVVTLPARVLPMQSTERAGEPPGEGTTRTSCARFSPDGPPMQPGFPGDQPRKREAAT